MSWSDLDRNWEKWLTLGATTGGRACAKQVGNEYENMRQLL